MKHNTERQEGMERFKNRLKNVLRLLWQQKFRIVAGMAALCILLGTFNHLRSSDQASGDISFNYSEASLGLSPNKTRFNSYEIISDEILEQGIKRAGLQGWVTAAQLQGCLSLSPVDTGNANGDDDYISTTYAISLNARKLDLKNRKAMDLLKSVCAAYRAYFLENYCDNQEILKARLEITKESEPYLRLSEIQLRAQQLNRYLNARLDENKSFTDTESGKQAASNFTLLGKRLMNLIDYDIPNARAYIIESGVARDAALLTSTLSYKNKIDDLSARRLIAYYNADKEGISLYEKSMTAVVMIPTTDAQNEYYMSRTKTAMDTMARHADSSLAEAMSYKSDIADTDYVIDKMSTGSSSPIRLVAAQAMLNSLEKEINAISEDLFVLDKSYIKYKAQNYITFRYHEPSFTQQINLKQLVKVMALGCIALVVIAWVCTGRKEKARK